MKKLYEKSKLTFAIVWIVVYCVLQSLANPLNKAIGGGFLLVTIFYCGGSLHPRPFRHQHTRHFCQ